MAMERNGFLPALSTLLLAMVMLAEKSHEAAKPLPDIIKPCARDDPEMNKCATANAIQAIPKMKNGMPDYGVPILDPLFIKEIKLDKKALGLEMILKDMHLHGLGDSKVLDIDIKVQPPYFVWHLIAPRLQLIGQYSADGRILLLPIKGKGAFNFTLDNVDYTYSFKNNLVKKSDGAEYLVPKTSDLDYKVGRAYFKLENLFSGNKLLGEQMNTFLEENWRETIDLLGPPIARALAIVFKDIVENLTSKVPFKNIFPDKV